MLIFGLLTVPPFADIKFNIDDLTIGARYAEDSDNAIEMLFTILHKHSSFQIPILGFQILISQNFLGLFPKIDKLV